MEELPNQSYKKINCILFLQPSEKEKIFLCSCRVWSLLMFGSAPGTRTQLLPPFLAPRMWTVFLYPCQDGAPSSGRSSVEVLLLLVTRTQLRRIPPGDLKVETLIQTQNLLKGLHICSDLGTPWGPTGRSKDYWNRMSRFPSWAVYLLDPSTDTRQKMSSGPYQHESWSCHPNRFICFCSFMSVICCGICFPLNHLFSFFKSCPHAAASGKLFLPIRSSVKYNSLKLLSTEPELQTLSRQTTELL